MIKFYQKSKNHYETLEKLLQVLKKIFENFD